MQSIINPKIGDVYLINFSGDYSEQKGLRPGIIIQNNTGNTFSPNVIAIPLTTCLKKTGQPTHVIISSKDSGLRRTSMALCENPQCISKKNLQGYICSLSGEYMEKISSALILATSVLSFIPAGMLPALTQKANELNAIAV